MMALFSSIKLETSGGRTIEYIDHCHPNLLMYKLLTSTDDEHEIGFVRNINNRDSQLKGDHIAAERDHMYMMIKMSDLFGFIYDLEMIIYGLGFKLLLKWNNNDRALYRVNANPGAVANDGNIEIRDISWFVPSMILKNQLFLKTAVLTLHCWCSPQKGFWVRKQLSELQSSAELKSWKVLNWFLLCICDT